MTAPWNNQPTPLVDLKNKELLDSTKQYRPMYGELLVHSRDLERRMRAAEALLADIEAMFRYSAIIMEQERRERIRAHLAAAKEMDGNVRVDRQPSAEGGKE